MPLLSHCKARNEKIFEERSKIDSLSYFTSIAITTLKDLGLNERIPKLTGWLEFDHNNPDVLGTHPHMAPTLLHSTRYSSAQIDTPRLPATDGEFAPAHETTTVFERREWRPREAGYVG